MDTKDNETVDDLIKEGLRVIQARRGYRFSLDAVLLAGFVTVLPGDLVCDLGAGSGVISILLAQREKTCRVKALELQESLWDRAVRSVQLNRLQDRIEVTRGDIRRIEEKFSPQEFDVVVANPPFWEVGKGRLSANPEVALARHELAVTLRDIIVAASWALKRGGRLALIHRASRLDEIVQLAEQCRIPVKRMRAVYPYRQRPANLVLIEGIKEAKRGVEILPPLVVYEEDGRYTGEIMHLYYGEEA